MPQDLRITVDELRKRMDGGEDFTIIDARNPQAWAKSSEKLPDALRIPVDAFEQNVSRIPRNKPVVVYCT